MNKFPTGPLLAAILSSALASAACAQESGAPLIKTDINADAEHAELCLEFDKPVKAAASLKLEMDGKPVALPTTAIAGSALCLFPLEHGKNYRLDISNLRLGDDGKFSRRISFDVPDRTPSLAFAGEPDGFAPADKALTLRGVNVAQARLEIYRVSDKTAMAQAWLNRAQAALAPSESIYIAKTKGEKIWQGEVAFDAPANKAGEKKISLREILPDAGPGLYLIAAGAGKSGDVKALEPLAALWLTQSDFSLRSLRDGEIIHAFAARRDQPGVKSGLHLTIFSKKPEQIAESDGAAVTVPADQASNPDIAALMASDAAGNIAFADIEKLSALSSTPAPGMIRAETMFALPGSPVAADLSLATARPLPAGGSFVHIAQDRAYYTDIPAPSVGADGARISFIAPAAQGNWTLRWQKQDGGLLAETGLRVTANGDAPHLEIGGSHEMLGADLGWSGEVKSLTSAGAPAPVTGGHIGVVWQPLDPAAFGWKDYRFGLPAAFAETPVDAGSFVTDPNGAAPLHMSLPRPPPEHGLYQAVIRATADPDSGVADAAPLILPLRPDTTVIGIKPLADGGHFPQNGVAHFAVIGVGGDFRPRDIDDLSYQIYEEGRHFAWYQEDGRWQYRPEAQLRPIGGGDLAIRADGGSQIEWPVTAGNYRLEILDSNGKILAQTGFSAGGNAAAYDMMPLDIALPKILQPGHEAVAHIHLPEGATVTTVISAPHILKIMQEARPKGDNAIAFTPASDWPDSVMISITAAPAGDGRIMQGAREIALAQSGVKNPAAGANGVSIWSTEDPAALVLRKGSMASLGFAIANSGAGNETYHYIFTASPGLVIGNGDKGDVNLGGGQSLALPVAVTATTPGSKEIRLEASNGKNRITRSWSLGVVDNNVTLKSDESVKIEARQPLAPDKEKNRGADAVVLLARHSMDGLAELLTYLLTGHPFTTQELGASIEALRLWDGVATQAGLVPENAAAARRRQQIMQLLLRQNNDGGFAAWRGGDSDMADTAAALTALGPDTPGQAATAKNLAINWIKQRLSNSWIDPQERPNRAAAYAALAAADATDPASLRYFSDTSAQEPLPALAEANIAAAFKRAHDPNAAAFWIKKMIDEHGAQSDIALLNALAATDALSSDAVHGEMAKLAGALRKSGSPAILETAQLLRAISVDNADAGKGRVSNGHITRDIDGVLVLHANDIAAYANSDAQPLYATYLSEAARQRRDGAITRHIYRLNGVELPAGSKPTHGEIYMVELKGAALGDGEMLVQDGGNGLRPVGCPLSAKTQGLSFVPWFAPHGLTGIVTCEFSAHRMNAVLSPDGDDVALTYFATIDAASIGDLPPAKIRPVK